MLTLPNAAIERARLTLGAARAIADLGVLKFNGYNFSINAQPNLFIDGREIYFPYQLFASFRIVFHDLQEPQVTFGNNHGSVNILEGLNKFGSYDTSPKAITIVPVCTTEERQQMAELILGSFKLGSTNMKVQKRTFGVGYLAYTTQHIRILKRNVNASSNSIQHGRGQYPFQNFWSPSLTTNMLWMTDSHISVSNSFCLNGVSHAKMLDTPTLQNPDWKDLNLSLNLVSKCGLVPWVLSERLPEAECFIGMAYTTTRNSRNREKLMGFVSVFDEYGKWRFYKG